MAKDTQGTKNEKGNPKSDKPKKAKRRLDVGQMFREVVSELKKVNWPTRKELISYTGIVLLFVAVMAVFIWIVDLPLSSAFTWLVG